MLPAIAALGLPLLVVLARRSAGAARRPARWALAWLGWAAVATALAPQPVVAFWGVYRIGTGFVFLAALASCWAIGTRAGPRGARAIASALLAACAINAAVGLLAMLVDLSAFGVGPVETRAAAFYGNPVYLGELLCGGLWIALIRLGQPEPRRWAVAAGVLVAAGIEVSGSRAALALALAAGVVAAVRARGSVRLMAATVVAGGIALGATVGAIAPVSTTGTDRVSSVAVADAGVANRVETWREGLAALETRPLWGWGPGGTLAATGPRRTLTIAKAEGPEAMFADAHDVVIESAVTTGVVGLVLLVGWLWAGVVGARRRPTGEGLLGFAALVTGVSLLEPMHVGVTPLAALALGGAAAWGAGGRTARASRLAGVAVTLVGIATSVTLLAGLMGLHQADLNADPTSATSASRLLPPWGESDAVVGRLVAFQGITGRDPAKLDAAIRWWSAAAQRDRVDPSRWNDLAGALEHAGRLDQAATAYVHALADNPWSARALAGVVRIGPRGGFSPAAVAAARAKLAMLGA
jgi:O-antigen ligase